MAYYLKDDPYRTSARTYGITQLSSGLKPLVYNPDPTTKLDQLYGLLGKTTKVKEEDKPRIPEPTNYKKIAKCMLALSIVLIIMILPPFYFIRFMIYAQTLLFSMYAR